MTRPRRRVGLLVRAGVLVLTAALLAPTAAWSAPRVLPTPQAPVPLPAAAEPSQPYVAQVSCAPKVKPGVRKFRDLMLDTYGRGHDGGASRDCAVGARSEHKEGRAWDWMLDARKKKDRKVAKRVLRWLLADGPDGRPALNARRLGIMYVIWDGRIWGSYNNTWKPLSPGSHQHRDHIHFSFSWAGATGKTSFWTGRVRKVDYGPCPVYRGEPAPVRRGPNRTPCDESAQLVPPRTSLPTLVLGARSSHVAWAQDRLGVPATGRLDKRTRKALLAYQERVGLPRTGALDQPTWARLRPAAVVTPAPQPSPSPAPSPTASSTAPAVRR